jgi:hypothetical protein
VAVIGDPRPLEDDGLVAAVLRAKAWEPDLAPGGTTLREVLKRFAQRL